MSLIVIIDDSAAVLSLIAHLLKLAGHEANGFTSARPAIAFLDRTKVDLVITDIYMPDEDGLQVIRTCKSRFPGIPVIAISGAEGVKDMTKVARQLGAVATLRKPFTNEGLLGVVTSTLAAFSQSELPHD